MIKDLLLQQQVFNRAMESPQPKAPPKAARRSGLVGGTPQPKRRGRPKKQTTVVNQDYVG